MARFTAILLILLTAAAFVSAQSRPAAKTGGQKANQRPVQPPTTPTPQATAPEPDDEIILVSTNLVTVPVKVSDRNGRFIAGLKKADFQIFEDDVLQEIEYFSNEEQPFTVALVLDMSYSSKFKIADIQAAAKAFISQLRPADRVMIISFDSEINVLTEITTDRERIRSAIRQTKIATGTSLYEAVDFIVNERFKKLDGRKAIVLFTDGVDTTSIRVDAAKNLNDVYELDSLIYPIEYDTYSDVQRVKNSPTVINSPVPSSTPTRLPFPIPSIGVPGNRGTTMEEYQKAHEYLKELSDRTGGRMYRADNLANLADAFSKIAAELRQTYSLGFYPGDDKKPQKHKLRVRVSKKGYVVRARDSYIAKSSK